MKNRIITIVLLIISLVLLGALGYYFSSKPLYSHALEEVGNQKGYEPIQPSNFSHKLHAGELEIDCKSCHSKNKEEMITLECNSCHQQDTVHMNLKKVRK